MTGAGARLREGSVTNVLVTTRTEWEHRLDALLRCIDRTAAATVTAVQPRRGR